MQTKLQQTQVDVSATADELRDFIARSRGKSPQEVLGMIAQSGLFQSTALATGLVVGVLVLLTIVPYALGHRGKQDKSPPVAKETTDNVNDSSTTPAVDQAATADNETAASNNTTSTADPALKALGIDETKTADPDKNPLENSLDDLLDNVK